jgi:hypothetical protein
MGARAKFIHRARLSPREPGPSQFVALRSSKRVAHSIDAARLPLS